MPTPGRTPVPVLRNRDKDVFNAGWKLAIERAGVRWAGTLRAGRCWLLTPDPQAGMGGHKRSQDHARSPPAAAAQTNEQTPSQHHW
jgi:hypothetical protein